jgi:hypothetical protein
LYLQQLQKTLSIALRNYITGKKGFSQQHDNINDLRNKLATVEQMNIKSDLNLRLATQYLTKPES